MEEININEILDVIEFKDTPVSESVKRDEYCEEEQIRLYVPPRVTKKRSGIIRFLFTTAVFFLLFFSLALLIEYRQADGEEDTDDYLSTGMTPSTSEAEETDCSVPAALYPPIVIDESKSGLEININNNEGYTLHPLMMSSDGVKVLIVHSHNSEYVSDSLTVTDAGDVITKLLISAGIETYHCVAEHDAEGNIGSYLRMKESVAALIEKHPDTVCVIDIHDSDSGLPVTFTVGTEGLGWNENLRLAEAVCGRMTKIKTAFRFLPGTLGQNSGILTLNVGLSGKGTSDDDVRASIAAFANAFIEICNEKASAP